MSPQPARPAYRVHNPELATLIKDSYTKADLNKLLKLLGKHNTLWLRRYKAGGSSAVTITDLHDALESALGDNLQFHWIRDGVIQALAELMALSDDKLKEAMKVTSDQWRRGLLYDLKFYEMNQGDFVNIIDGKVSGRHEAASQHPAIRINAQNPKGIPWPWSHKQNDAHGALTFLLFWQLNEGHLDWNDPEVGPVAAPYVCLLHHLFNKVNVWTDEDFGAWEDKPAVHWSSIMCVAIALAVQLKYLRQHGGVISFYTFGRTWEVHDTGVERLLNFCLDALKSLGTKECVVPFTRDADLAQLNGLLMQTLARIQLIDDYTVDQIIINLETTLMNEYGIARYFADTWDGRENRMEFVKGRDEMRWCHGSPTICYILGERYLRTGDEKYLEWATYHFNRTLGSITAKWVTPEAYRIDKVTKQWDADENRPLAWTQAVTAMAFAMMRQCVEKKAHVDAAAKHAAQVSAEVKK